MHAQGYRPIYAISLLSVLLKS